MKFELLDFAKKAYTMTTPKKAVQQNVSKPSMSLSIHWNNWVLDK